MKFHHLCLVLQDNVVCLSPRLAQSLGNMGQVCVCVRVTSTIHLIDPNTLQSEYSSVLRSSSQCLLTGGMDRLGLQRLINITD